MTSKTSFYTVQMIFRLIVVLSFKELIWSWANTKQATIINIKFYEMCEEHIQIVGTRLQAKALIHNRWLKLSFATKNNSSEVRRKCLKSEEANVYLNVYLTHSEWRPQNILKKKKTSIWSSNWQHKFLYFHYKSVKLDVLCRQNKIWTYGHPFQSKMLQICNQNSDLQSLYMLPILGFADYFS